MTRKELATAIYRMDYAKGIRGSNCSEKEWVKRALNGIGYAKPFKKSELQEIYNRKLAETENQI